MGSATVFRMGKHDIIAAQIAERWAGIQTPYHPCYLEYFRLFNTQDYYGAHDVLEHIWLKSIGEKYTFYKALIQLAGGFVHLKQQHNEPTHHVHGRRLRPAARLFQRCAMMLGNFPSVYEGMDVAVPRNLATTMVEALEQSNFTLNPWCPTTAPQLNMPL